MDKSGQMTWQHEKIQPIRPNEVDIKEPDALPSFMIGIFNDLIKKEMQGYTGKAVVCAMSVHEAIDLAIKSMDLDPDFVIIEDDLGKNTDLDGKIVVKFCCFNGSVLPVT